MNIHPVFHISKLNPVATDPFPGQVQPEAQPIEAEGNIAYEVEEVLDSKRVQGGRVQYLVKWVGYDAPTWEKSTNLDNCDALLDTFHRLYPMKPRSPPSSRGTRF